MKIRSQRMGKKRLIEQRKKPKEGNSMGKTNRGPSNGGLQLNDEDRNESRKKKERIQFSKSLEKI